MLSSPARYHYEDIASVNDAESESEVNNVSFIFWRTSFIPYFGKVSVWVAERVSEKFFVTLKF